MGKVMALLLVCIPTLATAQVCGRCHFDNKAKLYTPNSAALQLAITNAAKHAHVTLSDNDRSTINWIVRGERPDGKIQYFPREVHHGLGQGKRGTYRSVGIPWGIECASCEIEMMIKYIHGRYKTFGRAKAHWKSHHWY